jgi:hypothetical protein
MGEATSGTGVTPQGGELTSRPGLYEVMFNFLEKYISLIYV